MTERSWWVTNPNGKRAVYQEISSNGAFLLFIHKCVITITIIDNYRHREYTLYRGETEKVRHPQWMDSFKS